MNSSRDLDQDTYSHSRAITLSNRSVGNIPSVIRASSKGIRVVSSRQSSQEKTPRELSRTRDNIIISQTQAEGASLKQTGIYEQLGRMRQQFQETVNRQLRQKQSQHQAEVRELKSTLQMNRQQLAELTLRVKSLEIEKENNQQLSGELQRAVRSTDSASKQSQTFAASRLQDCEKTLDLLADATDSISQQTRSSRAKISLLEGIITDILRKETQATSIAQAIFQQTTQHAHTLQALEINVQSLNELYRSREANYYAIIEKHKEAVEMIKVAKGSNYGQCATSSRLSELRFKQQSLSNRILELEQLSTRSRQTSEERELQARLSIEELSGLLNRYKAEEERLRKDAACQELMICGLEAKLGAEVQRNNISRMVMCENEELREKVKQLESREQITSSIALSLSEKLVREGRQREDAGCQSETSYIADERVLLDHLETQNNAHSEVLMELAKEKMGIKHEYNQMYKEYLEVSEDHQRLKEDCVLLEMQNKQLHTNLAHYSQTFDQQSRSFKEVINKLKQENNDLKKSLSTQTSIKNLSDSYFQKAPSIEAHSRPASFSDKPIHPLLKAKVDLLINSFQSFGFSIPVPVIVEKSGYLTHCELGSYVMDTQENLIKLSEEEVLAAMELGLIEAYIK